MARQAAATGSRRSARRRTSATTTTCGSRRSAERVEALNAQLRAEGIPVDGAERRRGGRDRGRGALARRSWRGCRSAPGAGSCSSRRRARSSDSLARRVAHLAERGHRALIAHPERHLSADMFERMAALVDAGALVQATADFFLRERPRPGWPALAEAAPRPRPQQRRPLLPRRPAAPPGRRFREAARDPPIAPHVDWIATAPTLLQRERAARPLAPSLAIVPVGRSNVLYLPRISDGPIRYQKKVNGTPAGSLSSPAARPAAPAPRPPRARRCRGRAEEVGGAGGGADPQRLLPLPARPPCRRPARPSSSRRSPRGSRARSAAGSAPRPPRRATTIAGSSARVTIAAPAPASSSRSIAARIRASVSTGPSMNGPAPSR